MENLEEPDGYSLVEDITIPETEVERFYLESNDEGFFCMEMKDAKALFGHSEATEGGISKKKGNGFKIFKVDETYEDLSNFFQVLRGYSCKLKPDLFFSFIKVCDHYNLKDFGKEVLEKHQKFEIDNLQELEDFFSILDKLDKDYIPTWATPSWDEICENTKKLKYMIFFEAPNHYYFHAMRTCIYCGCNCKEIKKDIRTESVYRKLVSLYKTRFFKESMDDVFFNQEKIEKRRKNKRYNSFFMESLSAFMTDFPNTILEESSYKEIIEEETK